MSLNDFNAYINSKEYTQGITDKETKPCGSKYNYVPKTKKPVNVLIKNSKKTYEGVSVFFTTPYDTNLINIIKSAPERFWHADKKCWEVAKRYSDGIIERIKKLGYEVIIEDVSKDLKETIEKTSHIDIPKDYKFKTEPFEQYQLDGIIYGINNDKFLLGDEQGLGKTYQSLNIACIRKQLEGFKHCLVICCINGNKYNWEEEVVKHTYETGYILGTRYRKTTGKRYMGGSPDKLEDLKNLSSDFFQILNIEALRYSVTEKKITKTGKVKKVVQYPIVDQIVKLIEKGDIGYIIVDEVHKCKNSNSVQGDALLSLKCNCVAMSGTLLLNSPIDLYAPLKFVGAENHCLTQFKQHYCVFGGYGGHEIVSYRNLGELQTLLDKHMIRRLKKDELNLPPKIETVKYVEMDKTQQAIYDEIKEETKEAIKNIDKVTMKFTPLTIFTRMRQCTGNPNILTTQKVGNAKFDMLLEIANELRENKEKFIVYSNWTNVLNDAYKLLNDNGFNSALYTGENTKNREEEKTRFMTDSNCRCICGTIDAMGTGHTLTAASTVIFLDEPWNRGKKEQAEDRAHRIGTKGTVNIITLIAKDTIDEKLHEIVYKKGKMSDIIVDKEIDAVANEKMVQYLLS